MAQIRHLVIASKDPDATAAFYKKVFGLKELYPVKGKAATGHYLTDGHLSIGILDFKTDAAANPRYGKKYAGLHHIGFLVEDVLATAKQMESAGAQEEDIETPFGKTKSPALKKTSRPQYTGPDGVLIDINQVGWHGVS